MDVSRGVWHGWHGMGDGRFDAGFNEGKALSGGGSLRDSFSDNTVTFCLDGVHGCCHLGGPIESETNVDPQIFVSAVGG